MSVSYTHLDVYKRQPIDLRPYLTADADPTAPIVLNDENTTLPVSYTHLYGDWSDVRLKSWKDALLNNSIIPIQQYSYTTGKNATDSAMILSLIHICRDLPRHLRRRSA